MDDKLKQVLQAQIRTEIDRGYPNVSQAIERGRRKRGLARLGIASGVIVIAAAVAWTAVANPFADVRTGVAAPGPDERPAGIPHYEEVSEQTRAEIFAFRALAKTGLIDPYGARSYNWTYGEDTTETESGWRVGFAASDCEPKGNRFTCTGLSGEDPELGNALTDTYLHVGVEDGTWKVLSVEGNMLPEEQERVVGYSLPDEREPSRWDFAAASVWQGEPEANFSMIPIWVGPYPTEAPGSVCEITGINADGDKVGETTSRYVEAPNRPFERGGWVSSGGAQLPPQAVDVTVTCKQYTGEGWEVISDPQIVGERGAVTGVTATLEWKGPNGFTSPAACKATLVNESGQTVWEGTGRLEPLWRPDQLRNPPYQEVVFVNTEGEQIDAEGVGEFSCRSL